MLWRGVIFFFTFRPSDLFTTLTYVLMDNFCPCFLFNNIGISKVQFQFTLLKVCTYILKI